MYAIAMNDLVAADQYIAQTVEVGSELGEPDVFAVLHELNSMRLRTLGDEDALSEEATAAEAFGTAEGIASVSALAAVLWLSAGVPETAARIVSQLTSAGIENIPRDVDFLLTTSCIVSVAAAVGLTEIATAGAGALEPYAGRGVINAGAVTFYGVVDDYIFRARRALGETDADRWRHAAQGAYRRIGASWWENELAARASPRPVASTRNFTMRRADTGTWAVGDEKNPFTLADLKGLHYLRHLVERPGVDIDALELSDAVAGHAGARAEQAHTGDTLDRTAVAAYRRRLAELDDELDTADERGDQTAALRVAEERDALLAQLRSATGLGGRARRSGATSERARVAVRKAIAATVTQIERHDPSLARHLRDCVRTGASCRYEPNPDHATIWLTR